MNVSPPAIMTGYEIRECTEAACRFRFPASRAESARERCPWCGGQTVAAYRLPATAERQINAAAPPNTVHAMTALLDNVRSTYNVGSIFRSADGAGLSRLYLCGITPTPDHRKLAKTGLGAEQYVAWSHHRNAVLLAETLRTTGHTLWALETSSAARSIFDIEPPPQPLVLVVGSEVTGVDPELLALCDHSIAIPMAGRKRSLNVATAFGVAAVILRHRLDQAQVAAPPSNGG